MQTVLCQAGAYFQEFFLFCDFIVFYFLFVSNVLRMSLSHTSFWRKNKRWKEEKKVTALSDDFPIFFCFTTRGIICSFEGNMYLDWLTWLYVFVNLCLCFTSSIRQRIEDINITCRNISLFFILFFNSV